MNVYRSEAVVLRTWPVHEADQIVSLLTREHGKLRGVARAASRSRRRFGGALEPMTHVIANYAIRPRQELVRLDSLEIVSSPLSQPVDYTRASALAFYAEVLEEMLPDQDPQDATFRLLLHVLEHSQVGSLWMPVTYFAAWMVRLMGWMPELRYCSVARHPLESQQPSYWLPGADGLVCEAHSPAGAQSLSADSRVLAERIFHAPLAEFAAERWPQTRAADLRSLLFQALERHGEQRLVSLAALRRNGSVLRDGGAVANRHTSL